MQDLGNLVGAHLAHIGGAKNGDGRIPFQHGHGVSRLRTMHHLKAFLLERVGEPPGEEDIAVYHQDLGRHDDWAGVHAASPAANFSKSTISMISPFSGNNPVT